MAWHIGSMAFLNPWALAALLVLPILWYLLRFTPPKPEIVSFPPIRFLLELISREETPYRTPWWLILLRLMAVALLIFAIAEPVFNQPKIAEKRDGPLLLVIDDGWAAANGWQQTLSAADQALDRAARQSRAVVVAFSTPRSAPQSYTPVRADKSRDTISAAQPAPLAPDRATLGKNLETALKDISNLEIVWLSDGVDYGNVADFARVLSKLTADPSDVSVVVPGSADLPIVTNKITLDSGAMSINIQRTDTGRGAVAAQGQIHALALNGRNLATANFSFPQGAHKTSARIEMPIALRNEVSRLQIADTRSAGANFLIDDTWRRKTVGLVSSINAAQDQPLLSPLFYVSRALEPYAEVSIAPSDETNSGIRELIDAGLSVLIVADVGKLQDRDHEAVSKWLENGGTLVRFAGPRLAVRQDDLVPVPLRRGGRALGGSLSWSSPQKLSPFAETSPFFGLDVTDEVTVNRQVLAEPVMELGERTWARLEDGTPLVTARRQGTGTIVLFHVTAEPSWSNLPLSGLFVEMLRRMVARSAGVAGTGEEALTETAARQSGAYAPVRTLNGYGEISAPPADAAPVAAAAINSTKPSPNHPPGFYRRGGLTRAINTVDTDIKLAAIANLPSGVNVTSFSPLPVVPLKALLIVVAFLALLIDALASLWLAGRLSRPTTKSVATSIVALSISVLAGLSSSDAMAQSSETQTISPKDQFAMQVALDTRLGYVLTGNSQIDDVTAAGLNGLTQALYSRTSLEPETALPINIEKDDIVFFPLIYWPLEPGTEKPSDAALAKISSYLKNGGTIFFDTRDHQTSITGIGGNEGNAALQRIIGGLDIPPLETVPPNHVITKAFYLLQRFPGRWNGGRLWVEARQSNGEANVSSTDGVSSIIIGSNDYASAWARDASGQPLFATVPGTNRQREFALRTGINIVMYALTGNYKADQVHVPSILERLGQ